MTLRARALPARPRIGCVVNGGMGDQVLSLPALRYLAYWLGPDAFEVTFVGDEDQSWMLRALLGTYVQVRPASTVAAEYDWCLDMNLTSNPYRMPPHMAVERAVVCFERPGTPAGAIVVPSRTVCWRMYLEMAERLVREVGAPARLRAGEEKLLRTGLLLPPSAATRERVARWTVGFTSERPSVAVTPGGYHPGYKRWPRERFARVVAELGRRDSSVLLLGSERERELCDAVASEAVDLAPGAAPPSVLAGQVPLEDLPHLLLQADLHLTNDNGVSHVAGALHRPQVVLYRGCAERNRHVTLGFRDAALYSGADGTTGCMDGIQTEEVLAALARLLEQLGWPRQG